MVEKRPESFYWRMPRVRLFREELIELIQVLEQHGDKATFQLGDYHFDGLAELDDVPVKQCSTLDFRSTDPYVSVDLNHHGGAVHASADSGVAGRGMADQVRSILEAARVRRSVGALVADYSVFVAIGVVLNMMMFYVFGDASREVGVAALILMVLIVPWVYFSYKRFGARPMHAIHLQPRSDHPGFIERNRDQLLVNAITAMVGGVIGWVLRGG